MKPPPLVTIGISLGCIIGFGIHLSVSKSVPNFRSEKVTSAILSESDDKETSERVGRSTIEEIQLAMDHEQPRLVSHYLKDATIEEVIALLSKFSTANDSAHDLQWVIGMRGLELDADTLMKWARSRDSSGLVTTLYERWSIMDPHAALKASMKDKPTYQRTVLSTMAHGDPDQAIAAIHEFAPWANELEELERLKVGSASGT